MSWDDSEDNDPNRDLRKWIGDFLPEELFKQIEEMMNKMFEDLQQGRMLDPQAIDRVLREHRSVRPFMFGFSVDIGPDGKPRLKRFGDRPVGEELEAGPVLEPLVDVIEEDKEVVVVAELPGVEKDQIRVRVKGTTLILDVENPHRPYHKTVELPVKVKREEAKSAIRNGVLEVRLKKA
ncbi:MAG: Hsp20 family protein [Candidatus Thorarchaeota archaeon]|nr:Hsp20 family protein [Candidatus Thorarchaeota archaeon]